MPWLRLSAGKFLLITKASCLPIVLVQPEWYSLSSNTSGQAGPDVSAALGVEINEITRGDEARELALP